jgi:hypothetical protein
VLADRQVLNAPALRDLGRKCKACSSASSTKSLQGPSCFPEEGIEESISVASHVAFSPTRASAGAPKSERPPVVQ